MTAQSDLRLENLTSWLKQITNYTHLQMIQGDASPRRYFRLLTDRGSYIAVDAPPHSEKNHAFVAIAHALLKNGLRVPEILHANLDEGFLLLSDLGDNQLLKVLTRENVDAHYLTSFQNLLRVQSCSLSDNWSLPVFDQGLLEEELLRFPYWYLAQHLEISITHKETHMLQDYYELLISSALAQPRVFVHRDYHSRNLMVLPNSELGILDFQDAVLGPITYDLVSLLRDCYITWPQENINRWVEEYWRLLPNEQRNACRSLNLFSQWFDWMGLQRHLKVLGIFARLYRRDHKSIYLQDIPRVLNYVLCVCDKYPELKTLRKFFIERVMSHESNDFGGGARQSNETAHGHHS